MQFLTRKITRANTDRLISEYQTTSKTLDVGAWGKPAYTKYFPNRVGVDIRAGPGVDVVASVYNLPFENEAFDRVLCLGTLQHFEDPQKAIEEMRRVLKIGGRIILSAPFMFPINEAPNDYWRFTKFGLKKLLSQGWNIEKLTADTHNAQESFAVLLQRFAYQANLRFNGPSKVFVFLLARLLQHMPNMVKTMFGDIRKKVVEPEAFAIGFFLVAQRVE